MKPRWDYDEAHLESCVARVGMWDVWRWESPVNAKTWVTFVKPGEPKVRAVLSRSVSVAHLKQLEHRPELVAYLTLKYGVSNG